MPDGSTSQPEQKNPGSFWDEIFDANPGLYGEKPNDFLAIAASMLPADAKVLSLAEGEGRNAVFLAQSGCRVTCVDASVVAKNAALKLFAKAGVSADYVVADLNHVFGDSSSSEVVESILAPGTWDAIVAVWCHLPSQLRKKVHEALPSLLTTGGLFIMEGYTPDQLRYETGGPKDIDLLYDPVSVARELDLDLVLFQTVTRQIHEGPRHNGTSATLQVIGRKR